MRKQLYLDIQTALKSIKDETGKTYFKHFDLWNQNVQFLEQETPFNRPAVFVELLPIKWETTGNRTQEAELTIRLHIVTDWYGQTAENSPKQAKSIEYLDIPDKVITALQNVTVNGSGSLTRTQSIVNHNHEKYVDSVEDYTCHLKDSSAYRIMEKAKPTIRIITSTDV